MTDEHLTSNLRVCTYLDDSSAQRVDLDELAKLRADDPDFPIKYEHLWVPYLDVKAEIERLRDQVTDLQILRDEHTYPTGEHMHPFATLKICESVQRRIRQGDCPTEPPQSRETLEEALMELWAQNQLLRIQLDPDDETITAGGGPP